jgi:hypothetical protein
MLVSEAIVSMIVEKKKTTSSQKCYMFLFTDLVLVAKFPKGASKKAESVDPNHSSESTLPNLVLERAFQMNQLKIVDHADKAGASHITFSKFYIFDENTNSNEHMPHMNYFLIL